MGKLSLYPNMIDQFTTKKDEEGSGLGDYVMADHINHLQDAIYAIETTIGVDPAGGSNSVSSRLSALDEGKKLSVPQILIYSGDPSNANGSTSVEEAGDYFCSFSDIILQDIDPYSQVMNYTDDVISHAHSESGAKFYFTIDADVFTVNKSIEEISAVIERFVNIGIDGIYYKNFGYDSGVSRKRQIELVETAHNYGVDVMVEVKNPDEVFGLSNIDGMNIDNEEPALGSEDSVLFRGFGFTGTAYQDINTLYNKMVKLISYRNSYHNRILVLGLIEDSVSSEDRRKIYYYCQALSMVYSVDGLGISKEVINTESIDTYPTFPIVGSYYDSTPNIKLEFGELSRYTKTGKITVDTSAHTYSYEDTKIPLSFIDFSGDNTLIDGSKLTGTIPNNVVIDITTRINNLSDQSINGSVINFNDSITGSRLISSINTAAENTINPEKIAALNSEHIEEVVAVALTSNLQALLDSEDFTLDGTFGSLHTKWINSLNAYFENIMADDATIKGLDAGVIRTGVFDGSLIGAETITSDKLTIHANGGVNKWTGVLIQKDNQTSIPSPSPEMVLGKDIYRRIEQVDKVTGNLSASEIVGEILEDYIVMWDTWVYCTDVYSESGLDFTSYSPSAMFVNDEKIAYIEAANGGATTYDLSLKNGWNHIQVVQDHVNQAETSVNIGVSFSAHAKTNEVDSEIEPSKIARIDAYAEQSTQIIGDYIKTGTIETTHLNVEDVKTGLLEADLITAMELYVKELVATDGSFEQLISDVAMSNYIDTTNIRVYSEARDLSDNTGSLMIDNGGMIVSSKPKSVNTQTGETLTEGLGGLYTFANKDLLYTDMDIRLIDNADDSLISLEEKWYEVYYVEGELLVLEDVLSSHGIADYRIEADYKYYDPNWASDAQLVKIDRLGIHLSPNGGSSWTTKLTGAGLNVVEADIKSVNAATITSGTLSATTSIKVGDYITIGQYEEPAGTTKQGIKIDTAGTDTASIELNQDGLSTTSGKFEINSNGTIRAEDGIFSGTIYAEEGFIGTANLIMIDSKGIALHEGSIVDTRDLELQKLKIDSSGIIANAGIIGGLNITEVVNSLGNVVTGLQAQVDDNGDLIQNFSVTPDEINVTGEESVVINKGTLVVKDGDTDNGFETFLTLGKLSDTEYGLNVGLLNTAYVQLDQFGLIANNGTVNTLEVTSEGNINIVGNITANSGSLNDLSVDGTINIGDGGSIVASDVVLDSTGITGPGFNLADSLNSYIAGWNIGATSLDSANISIDSGNEKILVSDELTLGKYQEGSYGLQAGSVILDSSGVAGPGFNLGVTNTLAGWTFTSSELSSGNIHINSTSNNISIDNGLEDEVVIGEYDSSPGSEKYGIKAGSVVLNGTGLTGIDFTLDSSGITATGGTIGGWTIGEAELTNGNIHLDKTNEAIWIGSDFSMPSIKLSSDGSGSIGGINLNTTVSEKDYYLHTDNFNIDTSGNVSLTGTINALEGTFNGSIYADSGYFGDSNQVAITSKGIEAGGLVITNSGIVVNPSDPTLSISGSGIQLSDNSSSIQIGTVFRADSSGLTATAGKIANWNIEENLLRTDSSEITINSQTKQISISDQIILGDYDLAGSFGLKAGDTILNSEGITANSGTIAGWEIAPGSISSEDQTINRKTSLSDGSLLIEDTLNSKTMIALNKDGTGRIGPILLNETVSTVDYSLWTDNFSIDSEGNVRMDGSITSTSGEIGGWTVGENLESLSGQIVLDSSNEKITIGSADEVVLGKYNLTDYGIVAQKGKIGGWTIGENSLSAANITLDADSSNEKISIGTKIILNADGSAKLGKLDIDAEGNLSSTGFSIDSSGASFTGNISSASGDIGGWDISEDSIYSDTIEINSYSQLIDIKNSEGTSQILIGKYDDTIGEEKYGIKAGNTTLDSSGIDAKSGKIGGINISENGITSEDFEEGTGKGFRLYTYSLGGQDPVGKLEAGDVKIYGEVHANVGTFGSTQDGTINAGSPGIWTGSGVGAADSTFWISSDGDAYFKGKIAVDVGSVIDGGDLSITEGSITAGNEVGAHIKMSYYSGIGSSLYAQDNEGNQIFSVAEEGAEFKGTITATSGEILGDLAVGSAHNVYLDGTKGAIYLYDTTKEFAERIVRLNNEGLYISTDRGNTFLPALTSGGLNANAINDGTLVISDTGPGAAGITIRKWNDLTNSYENNVELDPSGINVYNGAITVHSDTTGNVLIGGGYLRVDGLDMGVVTSNNYIGNGSFSMVSEDYGLDQLNDGEVFLGAAQSSGGAVSNPTYHYAGWPDHGERGPHMIYTYNIDDTTGLVDIPVEGPHHVNEARVSFNPQWIRHHPEHDFAVVPNDACNFVSIIDKNGDIVRHLKAWKGGLFGAAFTPDKTAYNNKTLLVVCGDDIDRKRAPWDMVVFDVTDPNPMQWEMIGTIPVGEFPSKVECDDKGFAYCTVSLDDTIYKLDLNNMRVDDVVTLTDYRGIPVIPMAMTIANDYSEIYVGGVVSDSLHVIGTGNNFGPPTENKTLLPTSQHKGIIHDLRIMPDHRIAVSSASESDGFIGIYNPTTWSYDTYIDNQADDSILDLPEDISDEERAKWFHTCTTVLPHPTKDIIYVTPTNRCAVSILDYSSGSLVEAQRVEAGSNPSGIAISIDGTKLYVPNHHYHTYPLGSNRIWGYRTSDNYYATEDIFDTTQKYYHHNPSGMVMTSDKYLWVANRATDKVIVIDTEDWTNETKRTHIEGLGRNPYELRLNNAGDKIYVSNNDAEGKYEPDFINVLDAVNMEKLDTKIYVADRPMGIEISGDDKYLYVACYGRGVVQKVDLQTNKVVDSIILGGSPKHLELDGNLLYVSCQETDNVYKVDVNTMSLLHTRPISSNPGQMLALNGKIYIVAESTAKVYVYNINDNSHHKTINVGSKPKPIAYNSGENVIYVGNAGEGSVCIIDEFTEEVVEWCMTGDNAEFIVVAPESKDKWYVSAHGPEDIVSYGVDTPYTGDAYLDDNNITHKYGAAYWVPERSKWVRGVDNTLTSFSSVEFKPDESLQGKKGFVNMTVMGMFDSYSKIEQNVYPFINYSDGACEYTTETIELEEGEERELLEEAADYRSIPGQEKRIFQLFEQGNPSNLYVEGTDYIVDYDRNTIRKAGDTIPSSNVRANTDALVGETPVQLISGGYRYNTIEVYPSNTTLGGFEEGIDYQIDRENNTIARIIDSEIVTNKEAILDGDFVYISNAPVKPGSITITNDELGTVTYEEGTDYTFNYETGMIKLTEDSTILEGQTLYTSYIRTSKIDDGEQVTILYKHLLEARYYYHPHKRNFKDTVLSADAFWRWPRPGNQYVMMEIDELIPSFVFVDNDQIDSFVPEFDLGVTPKDMPEEERTLPEYKGLEYSSMTDRVQTANISTSVEPNSGQVDNLKKESDSLVLPSGEQYIQVNLGSVYYINEIYIKLYDADGSTVNDLKVEVSSRENSYEEIYSSPTGPNELTINFEKTFKGETYNGPKRIKYIRITSNGNSSGADLENRFKEVRAMGDWKVNSSYSFSSDTVWDSEGRKENYVTLSGETETRFDGPGSSIERIDFSSSDTLNLNGRNLVQGSVVVKNSMYTTNSYNEGSDYTVDYANGTITRITTGNLPTTQEIIVDYKYALSTTPGLPHVPPNQRVRYRIYYTHPEDGIQQINSIKVSNYYTGEVYSGIRSDLTPEEGVHYDYVYDYINNLIWRTSDSNIEDGEEVVVVYRYIQEELSNLPLCVGYRDPITGQSDPSVPASVAETDIPGAWIKWNFENRYRCDWYIGWIADIGLGDVDIFLDGNLTHSVSQHVALIERFSQISQDLKPGNHEIKFVQQQGRVNFDLIKLEDYQRHNTSQNMIASPNLNPIELFEWYPVKHSTEKARKYLGRGTQVMSGAYNTIRSDKETKIPNNQVPIKYNVRFKTELLGRGDPEEGVGSQGGETGGFTFERGSVMFTSITMEEGVNPTYWRMAPSVDKYPGFMIEEWDIKDPIHTGIQNAHIANGAITSAKLKTFSILDKHIDPEAGIQEEKLDLNYPTHDHSNKDVIDMITGFGLSGTSNDIARADHTHANLEELTVNGPIKEIGKYEIVHRKPLYGIAGDLQMQTSSSSWENIVNFYSLFGDGIPTPKEGATRYYKLYAVYGDNILETDDVRGRIRLKQTSNNLTVYEWKMPYTWGEANGRKDAYSEAFSTDSTEDISIELRVQNDLNNYSGDTKEIGIEWLELIAYDVYEGGN